jgi:hypothetical protein
MRRKVREPHPRRRKAGGVVGSYRSTKRLSPDCLSPPEWKVKRMLRVPSSHTGKHNLNDVSGDRMEMMQHSPCHALILVVH